MSKSPFYIAGMSTGLNLSNLGKANGLANFDKEAFLKSVAQTPEQYLQSFNKPKTTLLHHHHKLLIQEQCGVSLEV